MSETYLMTNAHNGRDAVLPAKDNVKIIKTEMFYENVKPWVKFDCLLNV